MAEDTVTPPVGSAEPLEELIGIRGETLSGVEGSVIGRWLLAVGGGAPTTGTITIAGLVMMLGFAPVITADPLGFYIGAGVGHSQVRTDLDFGDFGAPGFSGPYSINGSATGWKLMAGIRPLSILGAEVAYIDFSSVDGAASITATPAHGGLNVTATSHPKAAALFAVGYLPIPLPYLDVFAKAGVAQLKSDVGATGQATCPVNLPCLPVYVPPYSASGTSTHPVYGTGAQLKFKGFAVRAEFERISAGSGNVDLLSLGVTFGAQAILPVSQP
jgi:opacity protein-like surface antigen